MMLQPGEKIGYTESINQPTKIRLPDGGEVAITDWSWRTLYSCIDVLSGATDPRIDAFSYSQGTNVKASNNIVATPATLRTATEKDTNLDAGEQKMPAEWEYICYAVVIDVEQYVYVSNATGEAAYVITAQGLPTPTLVNVKIAQARYNVALEVTQKDFFSNKLGWFSAGQGAYGFATGGSAGTLRSYGNNGWPSKESIDAAPLPVHIGGTETYSVFFQNGDGTAVTWMTDAGAADNTAVLRFFASMVGLHKRPSA